MPTDILVATPDQAFGEWLRDSLADHGDYMVHLARSGSEVLDSAASVAYRLVILDADLEGGFFAALARALMARLPAARVLVIPPENDPQHPSLADLTPHGYLKRPFYFPDFLELLAGLLSAGHAGTRPSMSWLENEDQAAARLSSLLPEISAQAALIAGEEKVWASAGLFDRSAAQELAGQLARCCQGDDPADAVRYVYLKSTGSEHMIYTTPILGRLVLGLAFSVRTPLSQARLQAAALARALVNSPHSHTLPAAAHASPAVLAPSSTVMIPAETAPQTAPELDAEESFPEEEQQIDLAVLLAGMPPPDPDGKPLFPPVETASWAPEYRAGEKEQPLFPWEQPPGQESLRSPVGTARQDDTWMLPRPGEADDLETTVFLERLFRGEDTLVLADRAAQPTRPVSAGNGHGPQPGTMPVSARAETADLVHALRVDVPTAKYKPSALAGDTFYTCLLLPSHPEHLFTDELSDYLARWMPDLCRAFGWRLHSVVLRPHYMQLSVQLAPGVSPGSVVRTLRQCTSERIYARFPAYRPGDGRMDFWAAEYLVSSGSQPPPAAVLRDFIQRTRRRQGFSAPPI